MMCSCSGSFPLKKSNKMSEPQFSPIRPTCAQTEDLYDILDHVLAGLAFLTTVVRAHFSIFSLFTLFRDEPKASEATSR